MAFLSGERQAISPSHNCQPTRTARCKSRLGSPLGRGIGAVVRQLRSQIAKCTGQTTQNGIVELQSEVSGHDPCDQVRLLLIACSLGRITGRIVLDYSPSMP